MLELILLLFATNLSGIAGQSFSFGDTIEDKNVVAVDAVQRDLNRGVEVIDFDIYRDETDLTDQLNLTIQVPIRTEDSAADDVRSLYIIDFSPYSPQDSPIEGDVIDTTRISNCSNFKFPDPQTLESQFQDTSNTPPPDQFFKLNVVQEEENFYIQYSYSGSLDLFSQCQVYDKDDVWSKTGNEKSGSLRYETTVAVNHIRIKRQETRDLDVIYRPSYYTTVFKLSWTVSQYIFVNARIASQKRISATVVYASVQPLYENGTITDKTEVRIGVNTVLENAFLAHVMMEPVKEDDGGTFTVFVDNTPVTVRVERYGATSTRVLCDKRRNYDLEDSFGNGSEEMFDCNQRWDFIFVLPHNITIYNQIEGLFSFRLQLSQCDDLEEADPICTPVEGTIEDILADIALDTVVEITAAKENTLQLEVTSIRSKEEGAEFLYGNTLARGIYHGEDVVIYIQPTRNINKDPGADQIKEHGLALSAFLVCIESQIPVRSKLGCLEVEQQYRYIPWIEDDLSVSLHGKVYKRSDFEETKQPLNYTDHGWDPISNYYTIEFKNLALSSQSRLYKFTMIFRIDLPTTRKRRSVLLSDVSLGYTYRKRRAATVSLNNATPLQGEPLPVTPAAGVNSVDDIQEDVVLDGNTNSTSKTADVDKVEEKIEETADNDVKEKVEEKAKEDVEEEEEKDEVDVEVKEERHDEAAVVEVKITEKETNEDSDVYVNIEEDETEIEVEEEPEDELAIADVTVKGEVCPPGEEYVSSDEPCRPITTRDTDRDTDSAAISYECSSVILLFCGIGTVFRYL